MLIGHDIAVTRVTARHRASPRGDARQNDADIEPSSISASLTLRQLASTRGMLTTLLTCMRSITTVTRGDGLCFKGDAAIHRYFGQESLVTVVAIRCDNIAIFTPRALRS